VLTNRKEHEFREIFTPLRKHLRQLSREKFPEGHIPFIIVPSEKLLSLKEKIPLMEVEGNKGFTVTVLSELKTIDSLNIPESMAYLIIDIEDGKAMLGKGADKAIDQFRAEGRSPFTADEGVAFILQYPEILEDHHIDLPGSRHGSDKVAPLWIAMRGKHNGNRPVLDYWSGSNNSFPKWGAPSCLRRA
ncbi:MAG: hypothetical protein HYW78_03015, partial [Parcubacteria group bacterium]|nr:hypothetical protein [Parcubacteria group bacterium]